MPGANHDTILEMTLGQGCTHVRAEVIHGVIRLTVEKDRDHQTVHGEGHTLAPLDTSFLGNGHELGHCVYRPSQPDRL